MKIGASLCFLPKEELVRWEEDVVEEKDYKTIVRPRSVTQLNYGTLKGHSQWLEQLIEDVETVNDGEPLTIEHIASKDADFDRVPLLTRWEAGS